MTSSLTSQERIAIRKAQQAAYAASQVPLQKCNEIASKDVASLKERVDSVANAAIIAVSRALNVEPPKAKLKEK